MKDAVTVTAANLDVLRGNQSQEEAPRHRLLRITVNSGFLDCFATRVHCSHENEQEKMNSGGLLSRWKSCHRERKSSCTVSYFQHVQELAKLSLYLEKLPSSFSQASIVALAS